MQNRFIGVIISHTEVTKYFDPSSGKPKDDFDHFIFVPDVKPSPPPPPGNFDYPLTVYAADKYGKILNNENPVPSPEDVSSGHTKPATPHVQLSVLRLFFEQLQVLYPSTSTKKSDLSVYPHHFLGTTKYMSYKAETDDTKNAKDLAVGEFNPSPPKQISRTF